MLRRDLLDEMNRMREEMEQLWQFPRLAGRGVFRHRSEAWHPPTDVYETETSVVVRVEVGGLEEADFEIRLEGYTLTISGERRDLAAYQAGLETVILPKRNEVDLDDLPKEAREKMHFILVDKVDQVITSALRDGHEGEK